VFDISYHPSLILHHIMNPNTLMWVRYLVLRFYCLRSEGERLAVWVAS